MYINWQSLCKIHDDTIYIWMNKVINKGKKNNITIANNIIILGYALKSLSPKIISK